MLERWAAAHARDLWRERLRQHSPNLHDAAVASLTPEQLQDREAIMTVRKRLSGDIGERLPDDRRNLEQRADQVGLSFLYDVISRWGSSDTTTSWSCTWTE